MLVIEKGDMREWSAINGTVWADSAVIPTIDIPSWGSSGIDPDKIE